MHVMKPSLSIQLYSLRDLSGIEKILDTAKQSGFQFVELVGSHLADAGKVRQALDARGSKSVILTCQHGCIARTF